MRSLLISMSFIIENKLIGTKVEPVFYYDNIKNLHKKEKKSRFVLAKRLLFFKEVIFLSQIQMPQLIRIAHEINPLNAVVFELQADDGGIRLGGAA